MNSLRSTLASIGIAMLGIIAVIFIPHYVGSFFHVDDCAPWFVGFAIIFLLSVFLVGFAEAVEKIKKELGNKLDI